MSGKYMHRRRLFSRFLLCGVVLLLGLAGCGTGGGGNGITSSASTASGNISTPGSTSATPSATSTTTGFTVTSVDIAVNPTSLDNVTCGSNLTVTYTATFNFPANNPGGKVMFTYTTNNGRSNSDPQSLTISPGQGDITYQFTWSGTASQDHTMPAPGGVMVTAPNQITSQLVGPSGSCSSSTSTTPTVTTTSTMQVTSVIVKASPSLTGQKCGTPFIVKYSVSFHIAAGGPGGQIAFSYSTDNGRSTAGSDTVTVGPNVTRASYTFTWTGTLASDHTAPGTGVVLVTAPNAVTSTGGAVDGQCS